MVRKKGGCRCWDFTRAMLEERLATVRAGGTPRKADLRNFYYEVRNRFLRTYTDRMEFDTDAQDVYAKFEDVIKHWCKQKAPEYEVDPALYWRVREKINLWATGKAVCWKQDDIFPIMRETRSRALKDCSFILVCEKRTVGDELLRTLSSEGYHLNIIATVGHSQSDVQETILAVEDAIIDVQNFYVLILHDYDLDGVRIYQTLRQRHPGIIDAGVNGELLQWIKKNNDFDPRLLEERCLNKKYQHDLKWCLEDDPGYSSEDFNYLQGVKTGKNRWEGHRIEIDAIHAAHGIQPFVNYLLYKIETECQVWDLSKIGVQPFSLEEPVNPYEFAIDQLEERVAEEYTDKYEEVVAPRKNIEALISEVANPHENPIHELAASYWLWTPKSDDSFSGLDLEDLYSLRELYSDELERKYAPAFKEELDTINGTITKYEGDVREGPEDLRNQATELQRRVDDAADEDEGVPGFEEKLSELDTGDLDLIEPPDEVQLIDEVIAALQERRKALTEAQR
jgi:hypothetical protein